MSDNKFQGGGTPIAALSAVKKSKSMPDMQQTQQQMPPQMQNPQMQMPPPQMSQQMTPEMHQQMMHQQMMQQQMMQQQMPRKKMDSRENMKDVDNLVDNVASMCKESWIETIVVVVLSILTNNGFFYEFQNRFLPEMLQTSFAHVIISAIVSGIAFFLISQFIIKANKN